MAKGLTGFIWEYSAERSAAKLSGILNRIGQGPSDKVHWHVGCLPGAGTARRYKVPLEFAAESCFGKSPTSSRNFRFHFFSGARTCGTVFHLLWPSPLFG